MYSLDESTWDDHALKHGFLVSVADAISVVPEKGDDLTVRMVTLSFVFAMDYTDAKLKAYHQWLMERLEINDIKIV